jgi:hypothetical protein
MLLIIYVQFKLSAAYLVSCLSTKHIWSIFNSVECLLSSIRLSIQQSIQKMDPEKRVCLNPWTTEAEITANADEHDM